MMLSLSAVCGASDLLLLFIGQMGTIASQIDNREFARIPLSLFYNT
jgi:hypothetical protein